MANFAHIVDGVVVNVIVANSIDDAEIVCGIGNAVEYTEQNSARVGDLFIQDKPSKPVK